MQALGKPPPSHSGHGTVALHLASISSIHLRDVPCSALPCFSRSFLKRAAPSDLNRSIASHTSVPECWAKKSRPFYSWVLDLLPWNPILLRKSFRPGRNGDTSASTAAIAFSSSGHFARQTLNPFTPWGSSSTML
jgi:hypothetical protein